MTWKTWMPLFILAVLTGETDAMPGAEIVRQLTPQPQSLAVDGGSFALGPRTMGARLPSGAEHDACREVVRDGLAAAGLQLDEGTVEGGTFVVGEASELPALPTEGHAVEGYVLRVTEDGITARGSSPAGLLYAAQTLRQLLRISAESGALPCLTVVDTPDFRVRGVYIEGGQERFGRIVDADYLVEQIGRLAASKMNTLVVECYNLFPYASFPECADEGTLTEEECRAVTDEARRQHVTIIPSLQTLAQAYELVWTCDAGEPYRESTAPGLVCPSSPEVYPFIKGLYRDLLTRFDAAPIIGVGCSEIDMQWQERYCPLCQERVDAGETVRDLLLGHAERCIEAVGELSEELGRDIRPMMWGDEFYMYGPGKDWVGLDRIDRNTVMGYWKYWQDYDGIAGLMERGYDALGISAMYNHTFFLADLSPEDPPKSWPAMEQTGTLNITEMLQAAEAAAKAHPDREFWGVATASFSKHRLRAFDTIWYGMALNGHATWSHAERHIDEYQADYTRAFVRHTYDARTDAASEAIAEAWERLDGCKSRLELANQTLGDVVGVFDTQEAGYQGNTLMGAFAKCDELTGPDGTMDPKLAEIRAAAAEVKAEAGAMQDSIEEQRTQVGCVAELADLWLAGEKIAAHAEREVLMIDAQVALAEAAGQPAATVRERMSAEAERWARHRERLARIDHRTEALYTRGDPLGLIVLQRDVQAIQEHLAGLAETGGPRSEAEAGQVLIREPFEGLDESRWIVLGEPTVADGRLETRAPGGWENYCGVATREPIELMDDRPLVVEFELTPVEMGVDSQLFGSADETGKIAYQFTFYGPRDRFGIYTQSATDLEGLWENTEPGWKPRSLSPPVEAGKTYRVVTEITRTTWRATVFEPGASDWQPPLWDTGPAPMDPLDETRLTFCDVEPEGGSGASIWGPIIIYRR